MIWLLQSKILTLDTLCTLVHFSHFFTGANNKQKTGRKG
jgi:hypothetical protein